jgi:hypothetical protein
MNKPHPIDVCKSKVKYQTESIVQNVIFEENRSATRDYYKCSICNKYHITSISNKTNKRFDKKWSKDLETERIIKLRKKTRPRRKR